MTLPRKFIEQQTSPIHGTIAPAEVRETAPAVRDIPPTGSN